jgi:hypothetical protein
MNFSDHVASAIRRWVENQWFWISAAFLLLASALWKRRRRFKTYVDIWKLRRGRGQVNQSVVEQLFYRAARLAEGRGERRKPGETWREWIFELPDVHRRSILSKALDIFEKSKYGHLPISPAEFVLLEESIKELKL